jgi:hypothetical protein
MKILEKGKNMLNYPETFRGKCAACGCVFEYERKDIQMQGRNDTYVECPNRSCGNKILN